MAYDHVITELPLYKAALHNDWESASRIFDKHPELMTKPITYWGETPLMIAVGTNRSNDFVKKLLERIIAADATDEIFQSGWDNMSPLHYAAMFGNATAAELFASLNPSMTQVPFKEYKTPILFAAGHKETLEYLFKVTRDVVLEEGQINPYRGLAGGELITLIIMSGFFDVALKVIEAYPEIVFEDDTNNLKALEMLATKPDFFPSGSKLGFWGRIIYSLTRVKTTEGKGTTKANNTFLRIFNKVIAGFWGALEYIAPIIKNVHDLKVKHSQSNQLLKSICKIVIEKADYNMTRKMFGSAITIAIRNGIHELIEECIITYPGIVWYSIEGFYMFTTAVEHRQERVYNLIYQMSSFKVCVAYTVKNKENTLHIAGRLAPPDRLNTVTGAALQMQRELQWFYEVKKLVTSSQEQDLNEDKKSPRMVFTEAHKELLQDGRDWMKDTASSCTVVAALIVTMAFAAAFTVPGGNQDNGKPLFIDKPTFMLFIVSDAIALFSSSTSVLMFLGILTSRFAEDDFLYALPKRMTIGLLSLFLSLASTLIAFGATLALVLQDKVTWIAAPLVITSSIPVCLFGLLQIPLLVELVKSTYGPSIFHQQSNQMIH